MGKKRGMESRIRLLHTHKPNHKQAQTTTQAHTPTLNQPFYMKEIYDKESPAHDKVHYEYEGRP
jgi:hypothetical protein